MYDVDKKNPVAQVEQSGAEFEGPVQTEHATLHCEHRLEL